MANRHCSTNGCRCRAPFLPRALTLSCAQTAARQKGGERTSSIAAEGSWVSLTSNTGINKYINKMGMKTVATLQSSNKVERKYHQKAFCPPETQDKGQSVTAQGRVGSEAGTEDPTVTGSNPSSDMYEPCTLTSLSLCRLISTRRKRTEPPPGGCCESNRRCAEPLVHSTTSINGSFIMEDTLFSEGKSQTPQTITEPRRNSA